MGRDKLDDIADQVNHLHEMAHLNREMMIAQSHALADILRKLDGGMTPDEAKAVTERLKTHAANLEAIAAASPPAPKT